MEAPEKADRSRENRFFGIVFPFELIHQYDLAHEGLPLGNLYRRDEHIDPRVDVGPLADDEPPFDASPTSFISGSGGRSVAMLGRIN